MTSRASGAGEREGGSQLPVWSGITPKRPTAPTPTIAHLVDDLNDEQYAAVKDRLKGAWILVAAPSPVVS